jgi:mono/diheme cytochrome c family protein
LAGPARSQDKGIANPLVKVTVLPRPEPVEAIEASVSASCKTNATLGPWMILGPFDNTDGKAQNSPLPGQDNLDLKGTYEGLDGAKISWRNRREALKGRNRFQMPKPAPVACLLVCGIRTDKPGTVLVGLEARVPKWTFAKAEIYLNGRMVQKHQNRKDTWQKSEPEKNLLELNLRAGENHLLIKYCSRSSHVAFWWAEPEDLRPVVLRRIRKGLLEHFDPARLDRAFQEYFIRSHWRRSDGIQSQADLPGAIARNLSLSERTLNLLARDGLDVSRLRSQLETLKGKAGDSATDKGDVYYALRKLRRQAILRHPKLQFDRLLINLRPPTTYSHMCDQYLARHARSGPGLAVLEDWRRDPTVRLLLKDKLPAGSVLHPDLSFDGQKVVFSWADFSVEDSHQRTFHLYEMDLAGGQVTQLTGEPANDPLEGAYGRENVEIEDFDPCYLPGGGIVFVSTRNQAFGRCHGGRYTPSYVLYRMDSDASTIRRISFGEANEWDPSVLADGSLIYTRWDYINRHDTVYQSLWTTRPDGTATAHYYGNYTRNPCMIAEARQVPGSDRVVATAMGHHSHTAGSLILIDRGKGTDGPEPLRRLTPEVAFPETEGFPGESYATPWPISEDLFLASYCPRRLERQGGIQGRTDFGIVLLDSLAGRELIYRSLQTSCYSPIPIARRTMPPPLPDLSDPEADTGVFHLQNVYQGRHPLPGGSVKALRIVRIHEQPTRWGRTRSMARNEILKSVLGTVPVAPDGSVSFRAPANVPLLFQALDDKGQSLHSMRSLVYLQPGEQMGCVGCHEPDGSVPPATKPLVSNLRQIQPEPGHDSPGPMSYMRTVQPVLDRHCIGCHGLSGKAGGISLLGTPQADFNQSYLNLTRSKKGQAKPLVVIAHRNRETSESVPGDYGARAGRLAALLVGKHRKKAPLSDSDFRRIASWLDLNAQYYGSYEGSKGQKRSLNAQGMAQLRDEARKQFGQALASQPDFALVNPADPEQSRILLAPLAREAGGWGQIRPGWPSRNHAGYRRMLQRVRQAVSGQ